LFFSFVRYFIASIASSICQSQLFWPISANMSPIALNLVEKNVGGISVFMFARLMLSFVFDGFDIENAIGSIIAPAIVTSGSIVFFASCGSLFVVFIITSVMKSSAGSPASGCIRTADMLIRIRIQFGARRSFVIRAGRDNQKIDNVHRFARPCGVVFMKDDSGSNSDEIAATAVGIWRFVIL